MSTSGTRKKQLSWQVRNGTDDAARRRACEELRRIAEHERRLRGGGSR